MTVVGGGAPIVVVLLLLAAALLSLIRPFGLALVPLVAMAAACPPLSEGVLLLLLLLLPSSFEQGCFNTAPPPALIIDGLHLGVSPRDWGENSSSFCPMFGRPNGTDMLLS